MIISKWTRLINYNSISVKLFNVQCFFLKKLPVTFLCRPGLAVTSICQHAEESPSSWCGARGWDVRQSPTTHRLLHSLAGAAPAQHCCPWTPPSDHVFFLRSFPYWLFSLQLADPFLLQTAITTSFLNSHLSLQQLFFKCWLYVRKQAYFPPSL